ncbi:MAG: ribosome small subunit-dependent GTPase A [Candidatus Zixiibacteriota bacterium]
MKIEDLGWDIFFRSNFEKIRQEGLVPARVSLEHKNIYQVMSEAGEYLAEVSGRYRHETESRADFPAVGDWVAITPRPNEGRATIHRLLPRKSGFSRKAVLSGGMPDTGGRTDEQVLAANIDTVFLVSGLDGDYNLRRMERYITVAWDSGAVPIIVLNKSDLCENLDEVVEEVEGVAIGVPVLALSAAVNTGMEQLAGHLTPGKTAAFLGSSGVGKSTIINRLLGEEKMKTSAVSEYDQRGRHTTTHRELILLPGGGIVIDTPGMRELQLWTDDEGLSRTFPDVEALVEKCRFRDCTHGSEPGCAVKKALADGTLDAGRYQNYLKLQKELKHLYLRKDVKVQRETYRKFDRMVRRVLKERDELKKKGLI